MFRDLKDSLINLVTSRLFVLIVGFMVIFSFLIYRIFSLQIVAGETYLTNFKLKIEKERSIPSSRGNIYDRNGKLLAYNELAYTVKIEDVFESGTGKNKKLNTTIYQLIKMIESNGDKIVNDFNIILNEKNQFEYVVSDTHLMRFLADVYGHATLDELKENYAQMTATPDEVMEYLAGTKKYEIGERTNPEDKKTFQVGKGYTKKELLQIATIRYAMNANSYQKFIATTVATDVADNTVAVVMENANTLEGVSIAEDTIRKYTDSVYFSHIIGYTGRISTEELDTLESAAGENVKIPYTINDMIGKTGIEKVMEAQLKGLNGKEKIYVDKLGKTIDTSDRKEPTAGNDLYLTIDQDLQKAVYRILEQKIAGILVTKIMNIKEYNPGENASASNIKIPIDDVYFALINNNIINIDHFQDSKSKEVEKQVYTAYNTKEAQVLATLKEELKTLKTPYKDLGKEYQTYESYIVSMLKTMIPDEKIDQNDEVYQAWKKLETISLNEYLMHAVAMNWLDITKLDIESRYSDTEEIYNALLEYILNQLKDDREFSKKIYRSMLSEESITGKQICLLLWEQNIIDIPSGEIESLKSGGISSYHFMLQRIENLDITPGQLALDPCSGSCVITDVKTGEVLALVSYPSYDNNRLANSVDAEYFKQINVDLARPMWDYATQQRTAPGSTFKMVSAAAVAGEGVVGISDTISCTGIYTKLDPPPKCWIYANGGSHGAMNLSDAIANSCNYYFYEAAYRMSQDSGGYNSELGLQKLANYAAQFGLSETSGVEIMESEPKISDELAVPSAIGQGTHNYTTVGLARYVTAVANSGTCFKLSLLDKVTNSSGNTVEEFTPQIRNQIDLPTSTWNAIHTGMRKVVEKKSYYTDLGVTVAGKTGTAQENKNRPNHSLFLSYAPYENPEIAISTRIAFGYDSNNAAEITKDIVQYYFKLEDQDKILSGTAERPETAGNVSEY